MTKKIISFLTLFSSASTLVCCALPALLVTLGMGASLASFLGNYPQLIWLSEHKTFVFTSSGAMILLTGIMRKYSSTLSCPTERGLAEACRETKGISSVVFYVSVGIYLTGTFFAFIAPHL